MSHKITKLSDDDYARLANFRYSLRCFFEFSAKAAENEGVTMQQHQALLGIRGNPNPPTHVGYLAEFLRIRPNTAAELSKRLEAAGLITRTINASDRRAMDLELTEEGLTKLEALTHAHRKELSQLKPGFLELIESLNPEGTD
ncbi:MarR family winged helix-turn-helix transcriptional regulator [Luteolibacter algae]|uniref:MarR family winged helix-turn-helix transcriptional regulator n=1 Tax=Luteolibacter algae TaxID=454151 RepID=A0ABW5D8G4_9BACT